MCEQVRPYPYGLADFRLVRREGFFYADRTGVIRDFERTGQQLMFLRPRRFGKSMLLSMLENYYDLNRADEFEELFGGLAIGENPTPEHSNYFVLKLDFSKAAIGNSADVIRESFYRRINDSIREFYRHYANRITAGSIVTEDAISSFEQLLIALMGSGHPLYVMVDEYDNFANSVAMRQNPTDPKLYQELLIGEGGVKTFFATLKSAVTDGRLRRIFVTGVSPMVLGDITSGFNTAQNISYDSMFADTCGFTETEIRAELEKLTPDVDQALEEMKLLYNGYSFNTDDPQPSLYHPTLALYYLNQLQRKGKPPENPLDNNLQMDASKLAWFAHVFGGTQVLEELVDGERQLSGRGVDAQFSLEQLLKTNVDAEQLAALITFFGMATLARRHEATRKLVLRIPNTVIRSVYIDELRERIIDDRQVRAQLAPAAEHLFLDGDITPVCDLMQNRVLAMFSNRDYRQGEATIGRRYADAVFLVKSEWRTSQYKDILIEFKYLSLAKLGLSGENLKNHTDQQLRQIPLITRTLTEADAQRDNYATDLLTDYPHLNLHTYTILALGFDRLLWNTGTAK